MLLPDLSFEGARLVLLFVECRPVNPSEADLNVAAKSEVLRENQMKILYNWAAPETLFSGSIFSACSDVYSLSAVLWEVTTSTYADYANYELCIIQI